VATTLEEQLFGRGISFPLTEENGRLKEECGSSLLWGSVESIMTTEPGSAALDPTYGFGQSAYETLEELPVMAQRLGEAIARSEPRIEEVEIELTTIDRTTNTVSIKITITPITTRVPESRVYPYFGLAA
jgi:phage baseplate assembly protein W